MAPDSRPTRPVGLTVETRQETLSYEDFAAIFCLDSTETPSPEVSPSSSDDIFPQEMDVLCGRHREAYRHFGNRRFRAVISLHCGSYQNTKTRDVKTSIKKEIVGSIREYGGRFLKKDKQTDMWHEVGDDYAHDKVSHALRSANDPEKKCRQKKKKAKNQPPTPEEDNAFQTLHANQQRIFRELLEESQMSEDFEEDEQWCGISV
jgi:hypothetical protein